MSLEEALLSKAGRLASVGLIGMGIVFLVEKIERLINKVRRAYSEAYWRARGQHRGLKISKQAVPEC